MKKIKVLIVDDSAVARKFLSESLSRSDRIEVIATALDPIIAVSKIKKYSPDVITLDFEMPRMDGLTFLSKLMIARPLPVIMVSAFTEAGARITMRALELGAVDFILKPSITSDAALDDFCEELIEKVIAASQAKPRIPAGAGRLSPAPADALKKYSAEVILPRRKPAVPKRQDGPVIAMGASTGGTEAIAEIFRGLPEDVPGIVIVQHMPEKFTKAFADRINGFARPAVKEAENGDRLTAGIALIAPGNRHMLLRSDARGYYVEINDGLPVNRHRPSVDVLFRSVAQTAGRNAVGILLTGMGSDGAAGLLEMLEAGSRTIAQDEASSVVFGMPREAIKIGAAEAVMNIGEIVASITGLAARQAAGHPAVE